MPDTPSPKRFAVKNTDYSDRPFPHLVVDDLLPARSFDLVLEHWPEDDLFSTEDAGARQQLSLLKGDMFQRLPRDQANFWNGFGTGMVRDIIREAMAWLGRPLFHDMKPGDGEMVVTMVDLLQHSGPFKGLPAHTHYHNPLLLGTCIIYVDDAEESSRGTDIHGPSNGHEDAAMVAKLALVDPCGDRAREKLHIARRVAFKPNRGLVLMDGPISWHGAAAAPTHPGPRRQIIINWALAEAWIDRRHGVSIHQFQADRAVRPRSEIVRKRLARDVERQMADRQYSVETARALFETVPITVVGP